MPSAIRPEALLIPRPEGLYCPPGDFYIDPMRPVARALVTHAHSDHARAGHGAVLATRETLAIMSLRLGNGFSGTQETIAYGETRQRDGVRVTFHPAGHVLGSAQIALEWRGMTIVVSGDYKRRPDPTCPAFEPQRCDVFVTEATFGLPVFTHPPVEGEIATLLASLARQPDRAHLVGAYSLGKAQRLLAELRRAGYDRPVGLHGALAKVTEFYRQQGAALADTEPVATTGDCAGRIVLCPPSALRDRWSRRFSDPVTSAASGWMRIRARARQSGVTLPLVVSDHADWPELLATLRETEATEIWVTHGQEDALVHWCRSAGLAARPLRLVGYDEGGDGEAAA